MPLNGTSKNIENGKFDIMDVLSQFLKKPTEQMRKLRFRKSRSFISGELTSKRQCKPGVSKGSNHCLALPVGNLQISASLRQPSMLSL